MVSGEESGVDFYPGNDAGGDPKSEYYVVEGVGIVSSCFPAVIPGTCGNVGVWFGYWGMWRDEVGRWGEELVGGGEDAGLEERGEEV